MPRRLRTQVAAALGVPLLLAGCADPPPPEPPPDPPRLVVLISIDQLRPDRLTGAEPGGLGRLLNEGRVYLDAALEHAFTETCPGHATMLTGRHPARVGVPGNSYTDPVSLERRYCVEDVEPNAALLGFPEGHVALPADGRSPRIMQVGTLGDWLKAQRPGSRVFSVSGKDRTAITLAGRNANAAYWLARGESPRFVSSRYYMDALPEWVKAWGSDSVLAGLPAAWSYLPESVAAAKQHPRPDDYAYEHALLSRTQPHPLMDDPPRVEKLPEIVRYPAERLYVTPFADAVTLRFARDLVKNEALGEDEITDVLGVGLSATDVVGHFYGPESWESRDALARLDAMLGNFLDFLVERVGKGRLVVVVTADHGVLPVPEWIQETGRSKCTVPGGRVDPRSYLPELDALLDREFAGATPLNRGSWFALAGSRLTLNRARVARANVPERAVLVAAQQHLDAQPGIARVWRQDEVLEGTGPEPMATLYRNSWNPELTGDLAIQVEEDCMLGGRRLATTHGSPYAYDRDVPLIFWGAGVAAGRVAGRAATVDIAPTLAAHLGIQAPVGLDGRVLDLAPGALGLEK
jgi:hypothetical protein